MHQRATIYLSACDSTPGTAGFFVLHLVPAAEHRTILPLAVRHPVLAIAIDAIDLAIGQDIGVPGGAVLLDLPFPVAASVSKHIL